jgi:hypothetical protein
MRKFFRNNSLSLVFFLLFALTLGVQFLPGYAQHNKERKEEGQGPLSPGSYIHSGHFIDANIVGFPG